MTAVKEVLEEVRSSLAQEWAAGTWTPPAGDPLSDCEFLQVGFRSWALEAPDHTWRLTVSKLDFGSKEPTALLTVHAPNHAAAFGDLGWLVFSHSIGTNGGTNFNQCAARLAETLSAAGPKDVGPRLEWGRRLVYLIAKARQANAGANNGTFATALRPKFDRPAPYLFESRLREGRTISIFGAGAAGKTTIVDGLIASACSGKQVVPGWEPNRAVATLILDWDEGIEEEQVRLGAICRAYDIELTAGYHYKRMTRPLYDVADEVGAYIVANKVGLVVVSPMGRAQRDHGDNLTASVDEVHEILRSFGTTNILIDHVTGDNVKGGATREFGSVRKRDNVRGSYAVDVQSEEPGQRVLVIRNTKGEALAPPRPDQAVRVEYDPPWPKDDYTYDTIRFVADEVDLRALQERQGPLAEPMRVVLRRLLQAGHLTVEEIGEQTGFNLPSIRTCLHRYKGRWFGPLPSGRWEVLPGAHDSA